MIEPRELREQIDLYLDNALDGAARADFEKTLASDSTATFLLSQIKTERALRAAVYSSYLPSTEDAARFSSDTLIACQDREHAPVGKIAPARPLTRWLAVAAAIAVCAGSFVFGRMSAPTPAPQIVEKTIVKPEYNVVTFDKSSGTLEEVQRFATTEQLEDYLQEATRSSGSSRSGMIFNASISQPIGERGNI